MIVRISQNYDAVAEIKMKKNKIIVWDLFGGTNNSVYNALKDNDEYEVLTFDITQPSRDKHYRLDMTDHFVIERLELYPEPDIIVASPPCDSFSSILSMRGGGTACWVLKADKLIYRSKADFDLHKNGFHRHLDFKKQMDKAILGEKLLINIIRIIQHFKPKLWYIENPRTSLMWKYIGLNTDLPMFNYNKVKYGNYGFPTPKATIFLSNKKLVLNDKKVDHNQPNYVPGEKWKRGEKHFYSLARSNFGGQGSSRASEIPKQLLLDIFLQFKDDAIDYKFKCPKCNNIIIDRRCCTYCFTVVNEREEYNE